MKATAQRVKREIAKRTEWPGVSLILKEILVPIDFSECAGLKHALIGSTAERVVRHASCPVLVVREREHEFVTIHSEQRPNPKGASS